MIFYLGTHHPQWLSRVSVPLFVSHRRLNNRKKELRATCDWALDSGGFSELTLFGGWRTTVETYISNVRRFVGEIGRLQWAAQMDWMCEPFMLAKTQKTIAEHQDLTLVNFVELMNKAPDLPWLPVLQGWLLDDYLRHLELFRRVWWGNHFGLGSVCRRQGTKAIEDIVKRLVAEGLKLHGFGVKTQGLVKYGPLLDSSDSLAWSYTARRSAPLPGCSGHINCANCLRYALLWRERITQ